MDGTGNLWHHLGVHTHKEKTKTVKMELLEEGGDRRVLDLAVWRRLFGLIVVGYCQGRRSFVSNLRQMSRFTGFSKNYFGFFPR